MVVSRETAVASKATLAERMGKSGRQIQRQIAEMEGVGLIKRAGRTSPGKGKTSNEYDLTGLVNKMKELEPEFTMAKEEANTKSKALSLAKHRQTALDLRQRPTPVGRPTLYNGHQLAPGREGFPGGSRDGPWSAIHGPFSNQR